MGIMKGLKQMEKAMDRPAVTSEGGAKVRWLKLEDGQDRKSTRLNSSH